MDTIPYGYCHCGCGEKTTVSRQNCTLRGYVSGEPKRYVKNHHLRGVKRTDIYRAYKIVDTGYESPCWLWPLVATEHGYVQIHRDGKKQMAHRYYYERSNGPIPEGLQLDHLCRVRHCVNPDHLEPVTDTENKRRSPKTKLTMEKANEIRRLYATGDYTIQSLANSFGVSLMTISRTVRNLIWRSNIRK